MDKDGSPTAYLFACAKCDAIGGYLDCNEPTANTFMTQIVFLTGPRPDTSWLQGVRVEPVFPSDWSGAYTLIPEEERERTWCLSADDWEPSHEFCAEARDAMFMRDVPFSDTRIGRVIRDYLPMARGITMFDAGFDDTTEVPRFSDGARFLQSVERQLVESAGGEVFARFDGTNTP